MLLLGVLFAFATLLAGVISMAMRGEATPTELMAWAAVAGSFLLAGALAPRGGR